jgi:hypothetical protein
VGPLDTRVKLNDVNGLISLLIFKFVIPAEAGIQMFPLVLDSRFHGNDTKIRNEKPSITLVMPLSLCPAPDLWDMVSLTKGDKGGF